MAKISYLTCPHVNVQNFTECCLDCGWNIYTTEKEYLKFLEEEVAKKRREKQKLLDHEKELGYISYEDWKKQK